MLLGGGGLVGEVTALDEEEGTATVTLAHGGVVWIGESSHLEVLSADGDDAADDASDGGGAGGAGGAHDGSSGDRERRARILRRAKDCRRGSKDQCARCATCTRGEEASGRRRGCDF